ncbi:mechanosensitive ion channel family protein [Glycocaulis sp.]|uniref:mechanosensitive ion channel family protein n=1 Tax=Glycocaulis sp. TaxID=1969725 RepID=UPI003F723306
MAANEPAPFSTEWTSALIERAQGVLMEARDAFITPEIGLQTIVIVVAFGVSWLLRAPVRTALERAFGWQFMSRVNTTTRDLVLSLILPVIAFLILTLTRIGFDQAGLGSFAVNLAASLTGAWVLIRILTAFIAEPFWSRTAATLIWFVAALNIVGLLAPLLGLLASVGFDVGDSRISLLTVVRAAILLVVLYWVASRISKLLAARVEQVPTLTPSARLLITKSVQIALLVVVVAAALSIAGVDLSALAIFSGAVGLGIGFGLQKIFSNLISGLILLMDRSVKPGDVITLDETYGKVNALGMRFASVVTRDGLEHLIPNEEFITTKVINWSFSDEAVRIKRPVGVAYGTDVPHAMQVIVNAANSVERVLNKPETRCLLRGFGDNSIDLEVRFWIADPQQGVNNVSSEVLLAIWKAFQTEGIQFPFPQRDVHLDARGPVRVQIEKDGG